MLNIHQPCKSFAVLQMCTVGRTSYSHSMPGVPTVYRWGAAELLLEIHLYLSSPGDEHGHLPAVVVVWFAKFLYKFSLFQQGADNQVQTQDDPDYERHISERS